MDAADVAAGCGMCAILAGYWQVVIFRAYVLTDEYLYPVVSNHAKSDLSCHLIALIFQSVPFSSASFQLPRHPEVLRLAGF